MYLEGVFYCLFGNMDKNVHFYNMKQKRISFRIQIEPEKVQFIEDYIEKFGSGDMQKFVINAIDDKIKKLQAEFRWTSIEVLEKDIPYFEAGVDPYNGNLNK